MYIKPPQFLNQVLEFATTPKGKKTFLGIALVLAFLLGYFIAPSPAPKVEEIDWGPLEKAIELFSRSDFDSNEKVLHLISPYLASSSAGQKLLAEKLYSIQCYRLGKFQTLIQFLTSPEKNSSLSDEESYLLGSLQMELAKPLAEIQKTFSPLRENPSLEGLLAQIRLLILEGKVLEAETLLAKTELAKHPDTFLLRGRLEKSKKAFAHGLMLEPSHPFLKLEFANSLLKKGKLDEALCHLKRKERYQEIPSASLTFGLLAEALHQLDEAEEQYKIACKKGVFDAFLCLSKLLIKKGKEESALPYLESAIKERAHVDTFLLRGKIYQKLNKKNEAVQDLEAALQLEPSNIEVLLSLGKLYFELKNHQEAQVKLESLLRIKPALAEALKLLTQIYYEEKNIELALQTLNRWVVLEPEGYHLRAEIYFSQKKYAKVIEDCSILIQNPKENSSYKTYLLRGQSYFLLKKYNEALQDLLQARALNPEDYQALFYLARLLEFQNKLPEAIEKMNQLLEHNPENPEYLLYRGELLDAHLSRDKALKDINLFIKLKPEDPRGYFKRSLVHISLQNYSMAKKDLEWLIEKDPGNAEYYFQRGKLHSATKQNGLAHKDFNLCLQKNPNYSNALAAQGLLYFEENEFEKAIKPLSLVKPHDENFELCQSLLIRAKRFVQTLRYLKAGPKTGNEAFEIGIYYLDSDRDDEAINAFKQSLKLDSNFYHAHVELARIYAKRKKDNKVFKELKAAVKLGYRNSDELENDLAFALIRTQTKFKEILQSIKKSDQKIEKNSKKGSKNKKNKSNIKKNN